MKLPNYTIWCTYHKLEFIDEYDLNETDNFKLYYTNGDYDGITLNFAQLYLNEWVTQYYIWKNQLKSDYVGFCHYRRIFNVSEKILYQLENTGVYMHNYYKVPEPLYFHFENLGLGYSINILFEMFIKMFHYEYYDIYKEYLQDKDAYFGFCELYICKWNIFSNMTCLIDEFIRFIMKTDKELYEISLDNYDETTEELNNINYKMFINYHLHINDNDYASKPFFGKPRCIAYLIEHLIGIYLSCFTKLKN